MCKFQIKLKKKNKVIQFLQYDLEHMLAVFKITRNCFEVLNFTSKEPEELWNEIKEVKNEWKRDCQQTEESKLEVRTDGGNSPEKKPKPRKTMISERTYRI